MLHYQVLENKEPRKFSELKLSTKHFYFYFFKKRDWNRGGRLALWGGPTTPKA
jgi:hypothetical protein